MEEIERKILATIYTGGNRLRKHTIYLTYGRKKINNVLKRLEEQGVIQVNENFVSVTEKGVQLLRG
jgi:predicted methyltransferase